MKSIRKLLAGIENFVDGLRYFLDNGYAIKTCYSNEEEVVVNLENNSGVETMECFNLEKLDLHDKADDLIAENEKLKTSLGEAICSFTRMEKLYKVKCQDLKNAESKVAALEAERDNLLGEIAGLTGKADDVRKKTAKIFLQAMYDIMKGMGRKGDQVKRLASKFGVEVDE